MDKRRERDRATARNAGVVEAREVCEDHAEREWGLYFVTGAGLGTFGVAACCEWQAIRAGSALVDSVDRQLAWKRHLRELEAAQV